ncbi:hypothetical protein BC835DRAFT_1311788 [Cytidiella melzeri]|nr:hypothetical protein BC835DRAFT_1311788 [Cytidiella melzeri]
MARTRQTPKKTTGGKAPRKALGGAVAEPTPPEGEAWHSNNENGHEDSLVQCECGRGVCVRCAPQLDSVPSEVMGRCSFTCPPCELRRNKVPMTYRGLYNQDGCAMFPNGLAITPQSFIPPRIRCRLPRLCIINIYLVGLLPRGGPGHLLSEMVHPWYSSFRDESRVIYLEHILDVTGDRTIDNEVADMAELGRQGADYDMIMVFICTHSDETRGDLFFEPNGAVTVNDFFSHILKHLLDPLKKKEITMFLLACGAILHHKESSHDLKTAVSTFNIKNCFAFTSQMLLAYEIFPFVQGYAHAAVRQGQDSEADLERLLDQCFSVGLHTNIVWFMPGKDPIRYAWTENMVRPWGHTLSYQCSSCMSLWCWSRRKVNQDGSILFGCKGKLPSGAQCQATVTVINDMNLGPVQRGHKGVWMKGIL